MHLNASLTATEIQHIMTRHGVCRSTKNFGLADDYREKICGEQTMLYQHAVGFNPYTADAQKRFNIHFRKVFSDGINWNKLIGVSLLRHA